MDYTLFGSSDSNDVDTLIQNLHQQHQQHQRAQQQLSQIDNQQPNINKQQQSHSPEINNNNNISKSPIPDSNNNKISTTTTTTAAPRQINSPQISNTNTSPTTANDINYSITLLSKSLDDYTTDLQSLEITLCKVQQNYQSVKQQTLETLLDWKRKNSVSRTILESELVNSPAEVRFEKLNELSLKERNKVNEFKTNQSNILNYIDDQIKNLNNSKKKIYERIGLIESRLAELNSQRKQQQKRHSPQIKNVQNINKSIK
ncbi:hypothetical protein B5S30_g5581 [[Candida] boidinii]|nr:hypothetical protein B5S27_g5697 [[Candida] boidinii]OWB70121.1 hypothetical protein B5S30_g5581 [[Candida] boidinii]